MNLYGYNHLITAGCSNSSRVFGTPWSDFLAERFNVPSSNFMTLAVAGAGVSNYVDRVMSILSSRTGSLVIVQVTDPRRLGLGLRVLDGPRKNPYESVWFNNVGNYTWTYTGDKNWYNFSNNFNGAITAEESKSLDIDEKTCEFISKEIVMSDFTLHSSLMYLHALKSACDMTSSYLLLFPWFQNWDEMWHPVEYPNEGFNFIEQGADHFLFTRGFKYIEKDVGRGGHYRSDAHKVLANEYLVPKLRELFESKPTLT